MSCKWNTVECYQCHLSICKVIQCLSYQYKDWHHFKYKYHGHDSVYVDVVMQGLGSALPGRHPAGRLHLYLRRPAAH